MKQNKSGFTLIETMVAIAVLSILLTILLSAVASVSSIYVRTEQKAATNERGRSIVELMAREVTPAVVDTRMQFVIMPGDELTTAGAVDIAPSSPAIVCMSPLGKGGALRCVGYYLTRNDVSKRYRLKRIYIKPLRDASVENPYFPGLGGTVDARSMDDRTSPVNANWFTSNWDADAFNDDDATNDDAVVSFVANYVIGFWVNAIDSFGNPVPLMSKSQNHPSSDLIYNSAGYFYFADGRPFDDSDDSTFVYMTDDKVNMKANKVPPELEVAVLLLNEDDIAQAQNLPVMINTYSDNGALDVTASIEQMQALLTEQGLNKSEVYRTRIKLTNGG